ncbi:hypothetical protein LSTR_LSTR003559 [Laodelphax striatellus]|uniref:Uncharacterized protein n=1 Tax=Laodelphax striatellus TaxID=195883 RepID=A0A482WKV6_LAOST|nr:hypothetical protein LSTR_LSTR003559 [Laodelphax striatellus]
MPHDRSGTPNRPDSLSHSEDSPSDFFCRRDFFPTANRVPSNSMLFGPRTPGRPTWSLSANRDLRHYSDLELQHRKQLIARDSARQHVFSNDDAQTRRYRLGDIAAQRSCFSM